jgi:hypothetical protein
MKQPRNVFFQPIYIVAYLIVGMLFISQSAFGQCKTYKISVKGDTINCTTFQGKKKGKWLERTENLRGNPGREEEGLYINNMREGTWRTYSLKGDPISVENYRWGLLNGQSQYYTLEGLEHEESWKALDPGKPYDTIDVPDLIQPDVYKKVIVKNEGNAIKQGKWTYYDPKTGFILKTETYVQDSLQNPLAIFGMKQKAKQPLSDSAKRKALATKPFEIQEYEKKNAGKKKVKVIDGSAGY